MNRRLRIYFGVLISLIGLVKGISFSFAAQYWVSSEGDDRNNGSRTDPWRTIQNAASKALPGDKVFVDPGVYEEVVRPAVSGSPGSPIIYKGAQGTEVRGFDFTDRSHWAVVGFRFHHPNSTYQNNAISIKRATHFRILDNVFDSIRPVNAVVASGQELGKENSSSHGIIRSNVFRRAGMPSGRSVPAPNIIIGGTNNLIEYNDISEGDDFVRVFGKYNVIRNNYFHDAQPERYSNEPHVDGMQTFEAIGVFPNFDHNLFECNLMVSNSNANGHLFVLQNAQLASTFYISDFVVRQNVALRTGDVLGLVENVPNVRVYNNTFVGVRESVNQYDYCIGVTSNYLNRGIIIPTNFVAINNIFHTACREDTGRIFSRAVNAGSPMFSRIGFNLTWRSGGEVYGSSGGDLINLDPLFISPHEVRPSAQSPMRNAGMPLTVCTTSGTDSTSITVKDAGFFSSGWGIPDVEGDVLLVGNNEPVTVVSVDYEANSLVVNRAVTWNVADPVYLKDTQDIGAYAFYPNGSGCDIRIVSPEPGTVLVGQVSVLVSLTNPSQVRILRFYIDGLEVGSALPGDQVSVNLNFSPSDKQIQVRAYPRYAERVMAWVASASVNPERPTPVRHLRTLPVATP